MINKDELVVKSNSLIEASMKFTANEYKLITYLAGKIKKDDREFRTFEISIQELNKYCFGIEGTKTYNYMKNQYARALSKKDITIKKGAGSIIYNWFTVVDTSVRGTLSICFSTELKDFLMQTENNFTSYRLSNILNLKTFYSIRLYELLKQYKKIGKREISLEDLRFILGLDKDQYKISRDFRKFIIEKSINYINKNTDIEVTFSESKIGRVTKGIKFYISSKKNLDREISEIRKKMETVIGENVSYDILKKTISKYNLTKEKIFYYLDNWSSYNYKSKENPVGFLLKCVINNESIPIRQGRHLKPEQSYNFDQREYDDEFFEDLYDNLK